MISRLKNILEKMKETRLQALLVTSSANISYLTGYTSRNAYLIISKKANLYITDSRYTLEAKLNLARDFRVKTISGASRSRFIAEALRKLRVSRVGFEENYLTYAEFRKIRGELPRTIKLVPVQNLIEEFREIKNRQELEKIRKATRITALAFKHIKKFIKPGKKEIEIAAELEHFIRLNGARASAFEIIVASGPNSSFPHHLTSERKVKAGEPLLIDLGVDYFGYKSDLTRVFFLGKITSLFRRVYNIVLQAQQQAIKRIKPGVRISEIDAAARQCIARQGYQEYFLHNLGHGLGLEVHEAPRISAKENGELKAGMVFTVEPGIYLPRKFGVRLEDTVLVTKKGVEVLSGSLDK